MKKKSHSNEKQPENPYEKVFDDAGRLLKKSKKQQPENPYEKVFDDAGRLLKKSKKQQPENPYEKVFDDAGRLLKQCGDMEEFLGSITDDEPARSTTIPFPYGSNN